MKKGYYIYAHTGESRYPFRYKFPSPLRGEGWDEGETNIRPLHINPLPPDGEMFLNIVKEY
jgi:hypothetical protein